MFDAGERIRLQVFCEICDTVAGCRLMRDFDKQSHHIFMGKLSDGRVVDEYPRYDGEEVVAFLTHYRKLRVKTNRPRIDLVSIFELIQSKGDHADSGVLDHFTEEISEE